MALDTRLTHRASQTKAEVSSAARERLSFASQNPMVSIIIPMRNESKYIRSCLDSLLNQSFPPDKYEIVVADGRSSDNSRELVSLYQGREVSVRLLDNQSQTTPCGMNLGIRAAAGEIIIIAGAHTVYPVDFVENCVFWLNRTGADVVGGPVKTEVEGDHFGGRLASLILSSPFGVGDSRFRTSSKEGYVDTVPFGAYRRVILDQVGLFNEKLVRNQDNDLSSRIRLAGGKIYLTPALTTTYIPVRSYAELVLQAFSKSQWHILTLRENVHALGFRHVCPAIFLLSLGGLSLLSAWSSVAQLSLTLLLSSYLLLGFWFAIRRESRDSALLRACMPFACFLFHSAYGLGTFVGMRYLLIPEPVRSASHPFKRQSKEDTGTITIKPSR
jgi:cellulose synthase/poly-beta-1,6-N-acetylglucosamine synthase-like glycosyltransferase